MHVIAIIWRIIIVYGNLQVFSNQPIKVQYLFIEGRQKIFLRYDIIMIHIILRVMQSNFRNDDTIGRQEKEESDYDQNFLVRLESSCLFPRHQKTPSREGVVLTQFRGSSGEPIKLSQRPVALSSLSFS